MFGCLVNPITLQEANRLLGAPISCSMHVVFCTTYTILNYNDADNNWMKRVVVGGLLSPAEVIDDVPVINKYVSYLHNAHQNDDDWIIIQDMPNPASRDLIT
jgi:hypothetical protein